jgi:hypothetical protein
MVVSGSDAVDHVGENRNRSTYGPDRLRYDAAWVCQNFECGYRDHRRSVSRYPRDSNRRRDRSRRAARSSVVVLLLEDAE